MYTDNELIFPNYVIPLMRDMRGEKRAKLIDHVLELDEDHPERVGLVLMMVRFNGCMECETDSYRAMRGCTMCTAQMLRRYKGSDDDLLNLYDKALLDVEAWMVEKRRGALHIA
jgi:hypothetical protein